MIRRYTHEPFRDGRTIYRIEPCPLHAEPKVTVQVMSDNDLDQGLRVVDISCPSFDDFYNGVGPFCRGSIGAEGLVNCCLAESGDEESCLLWAQKLWLERSEPTTQVAENKDE